VERLVRSERASIVHSIVAPALLGKKDRTMRSQYERAEGGADGRLRTVLSPVVTSTGRLASGESFVDPASTNFQNFSKKPGYLDPLYRVRDCFIADPGMVLIASDLDKAEAVVMAFESQDWDLYQKFIDGEDIHTWVASHAYHGGNQKSVTTEQRNRCKNVLYASFYMAGIPKITSTINADARSRADRLTQDEVGRIYDTILSLIRLSEWWTDVLRELHDPNLYGGRRWLENCFGFRRMFYEPDPHKLHKLAVNFFPQSTVAKKIDEVMIAAFETLDQPGQCELLLQVHDELLFQVHEDKVHHYAPRIRSLMQAPFEARGREVFIPAGLEVGRRWEVWRGPKDPDDPTNTLSRMSTYEEAA
jgi:DNA polymerase I